MGGSAPTAVDRRPSRRSAVLLALRYYAAELRRNRTVAVPGLLLPALGTIGTNYVAPLIVAQLAGTLSTGAGLSAATVLPAVLWFVGVLLGAEVLWRIGIHCLNRTDGRGIEHLYVVGMNELLAKDTAFFHENFAGSLTKRVLSFASRFEEFVDTLTFGVLANLVPLLFASVVLWRYDPLLVVVLIGMLVVSGGLITPLIRRRQHLVDRREAAIARVAGHVADSLMNMDTVRAFAAEDGEAAEHRTRVLHQRRASILSWDYGNLRIDTVVALMAVLTNVFGLLIAVGLGGGRLGVEALVVTFIYSPSACRIMFEFNQIYRRLESSLTEAAQFTELLLDPPTVLDPPSPEPLRAAGADVRFERVDFGYPGGPPLFRGLDLALPSGSKVGFVGRSGGGKSHAHPAAAAADGRGRRPDPDRRPGHRPAAPGRPAQPDRATCRRTRRCSTGPCGTTSRSGGRATDAEVRRAAQAAHVTEFADALPDGFDTLVGERGVKLSGGQRQRVAIARAILRDAPILLLDEATSALDSESEVLIQQALWQLMEGRTALVVAHRLSTVARMDQLVVLDHGRVVEQGTHAELIESDGAYARLWRHQSGGFLDEVAMAAVAG